MKSAVTVIIAVMVFSGLALPASVNAQFNLCGELVLNVPSAYRITSVNCSQGLVNSQEEHTVVVRQSGLEGPECQISVDYVYWNPGGNFCSKFTVHQKFCFLKGGDITVKHIDCDGSNSRPVYTTKRGKATESIAGAIQVTSFDPPK